MHHISKYHSSFLMSFLNKISCSPDWPPTLKVNKDDFECLILLPLLLKYWECRWLSSYFYLSIYLSIYLSKTGSHTITLTGGLEHIMEPRLTLNLRQFNLRTSYLSLLGYNRILLLILKEWSLYKVLIQSWYFVKVISCWTWWHTSLVWEAVAGSEEFQEWDSNSALTTTTRCIYCVLASSLMQP